MRTLVIGDIHGKIDSFTGVLDLAKYNYEEDRLICIGDYVDGGAYSYEVVELLIDLNEKSGHKNIYIMGNHDYWFAEVLVYSFEVFKERRQIEEMHWEWYSGGGLKTYDSYIQRSDEEIIRHRELFFKKLQYYHVENNKLWVHAGYDFDMTIQESYKDNPDKLLWDRHLYESAINDHSDSDAQRQFGPYDKIYIGHTPTFLYGDKTPRNRANVINVDQGCKVHGTLTAWVDETDEYFQFFK